MNKIKAYKKNKMNMENKRRKNFWIKNMDKTFILRFDSIMYIWPSPWQSFKNPSDHIHIVSINTIISTKNLVNFIDWHDKNLKPMIGYENAF